MSKSLKMLPAETPVARQVARQDATVGASHALKVAARAEAMDAVIGVAEVAGPTAMSAVSARHALTVLVKTSRVSDWMQMGTLCRWPAQTLSSMAMLRSRHANAVQTEAHETRIAKPKVASAAAGVATRSAVTAQPPNAVPTAH